MPEHGGWIGGQEGAGEGWMTKGSEFVDDAVQKQCADSAVLVGPGNEDPIEVG